MRGLIVLKKNHNKHFDIWLWTLKVGHYFTSFEIKSIFFKFKFTLFKTTELVIGKRENLEVTIHNSKKLKVPQKNILSPLHEALLKSNYILFKFDLDNNKWPWPSQSWQIDVVYLCTYRYMYVAVIHRLWRFKYFQERWKEKPDKTSEKA